MRHEVFEGAGLDGALAMPVEDPEGHPDHVLVVGAVHLVSHHVAELGELDLTGAVRVVLQQYLLSRGCFGAKVHPKSRPGRSPQ